ncbi:MAG TPA: hypothetical protein VES65_00305 [Solirubrobacteraceae bacterium]|nr:hypothetical protein [Solirubrobacteraceae bacterium]
MTSRDRVVVMVLAALGVLAAAWLLAVAPEREQAAKLDSQVTAAQAQLSTAESQLAGASAAQARYQSAYASIVRLGKAVPASQEVPALVYQLARASNRKNVEFASITAGSGGSAGGGSGTAAGAADAASAGFTQMPFTFIFNGSFTDLFHLFQQLNRFTLRTASGGLQVSGRLLTIQSVKLAPTSGSGGVVGSSGRSGGSEQLSGTITATAYVLPAGQSLTGGATAAGPAGTTTQTASVAGSSGPANPTAVVQVKP